MNSRTLSPIAALLSAGGVFVSGVLAIAEVVKKEVPCGNNGGKSDCTRVAEHASSHLLGVPNSFLGLGMYLALLIVVLIAASSPARRALFTKIGFGLAGFGTLFSAYLTYISVTEIHATCKWCLSSAAIITVLFILHAVQLQKIAAEEVVADSPTEGRGALIAGAAGLGAAMLGVFTVFGQFTNSEFSSFDEAKLKKAQLLIPEGHILGDKNAPITIVEFADLTCPVCREAYPEVKKIVSESNGRVKLMFRHFPLNGAEHQISPLVAAFAEYAGTKGKFFEFVDSYYALPLEEAKDPESSVKVIKSLGLDPVDAAKTVENFEAPSNQRVVKDAEAAERYGLMFTPTYFVTNGKVTYIGNTSSIQKMLKDPELNKATP
ncbi:MAG: vitamin K epoxide reductase family protein [Armatimonadetes bacterium]|nr:vitamin K epoxide reductase family protein [Armatimonadota bacterium]